MNDQKITPFLFEGENTVRVIDRDGSPWFVAADVCRVIGLGNTSMTLVALDEDEKGISLIDTLGGPQEVSVVSEGGLYTLILRSRDATKQGTIPHRFRKWVTGEVLPSIHKRGQYMASFVPEDEEVQSPDGLKLRKINTATRCFGERAGAQLWVKLGLDWVPAMAGALAQADLLDAAHPPGTVQITVSAPVGVQSARL